jgi:ribose transport system ATP-binding protein
MSQPDDLPLLEVRQLTKRFPGVLALDQVDMQLGRGEVLAVIGENGAGKSTLMKILAGVQLADSGQVRVDGMEVQVANVQQALELGISLIHQELNLSDNLDVGANIFLGREPLRWGLIDKQLIHEEARRFLAMVGLDVSPGTIASELSIGRQQLVEIAKALSVNSRILIMDEPTSSLSHSEADRLFEVIRDLKSQGVSIIYISHRLSEVRKVADRVTILRDGQNAGDLEGDEITHDNMVNRMVGRDISQFYQRTSHPVGEVVLEVKGLVTPAFPQHKVSFQLRRGEILGCAGLVGAGRTEILQVLFGIDQPLAGTIYLDGEVKQFEDSREAIEAGLALVPEDRKLHGLIMEMPVRQNISLASLYRNRLAGLFRNGERELQDTREMIEQLRIKTPGEDQVTQYLSGGNQQKVVLGKWLSLGPRVILLDEPTRGIDVGAKQEIFRLMEKLAQQGVAILFVSSELEEIIGMSDRVIVMHEGRLIGELERGDLDEESIMQLATGNLQRTRKVHDPGTGSFEDVGPPGD